MKKTVSKIDVYLLYQPYVKGNAIAVYISYTLPHEKTLAELKKIADDMKVKDFHEHSDYGIILGWNQTDLLPEVIKRMMNLAHDVGTDRLCMEFNHPAGRVYFEGRTPLLVTEREEALQEIIDDRYYEFISLRHDLVNRENITKVILAHRLDNPYRFFYHIHIDDYVNYMAPLVSDALNKLGLPFRMEVTKESVKFHIMQ